MRIDLTRQKLVYMLCGHRLNWKICKRKYLFVRNMVTWRIGFSPFFLFSFFNQQNSELSCEKKLKIEKENEQNSSRLLSGLRKMLFTIKCWHSLFLFILAISIRNSEPISFLAKSIWNVFNSMGLGDISNEI